jgi:hypothetical protein
MAAVEDAPELALEHLLDLEVELEPPVDVGPGPLGRRMVFVLRGGRFSGPRMAGDILPGGGDWALMAPDGAVELDIRATFRTTDGAALLAKLGGVLDASLDQLVRILGGETLPATDYRLRVAVRFETGAEPYAWLNRTVCVGTGALGQGRVAFRIFTVR